MKTKPPEELARSLVSNPYASTQLAAYNIPEKAPENVPSGDQYQRASFVGYGGTILELAQSVLNYWTPSRIEEQALQRAGDSPPPSVIAEEVAVFNVAYQKWSALVLRWVPTASGSSDAVRAVMVKGMIWETLMALERRAQAAEARATDLRMRHQLSQITAAVTQQKLASKIDGLIDAALTKVSDDQALKELLALRENELGPLIEKIEAMHGEVTFAADILQGEWASKKLLTGEQRITKAALGTIAKAATSVGVKAVLLKLWEHLTS